MRIIPHVWRLKKELHPCPVETSFANPRNLFCYPKQFCVCMSIFPISSICCITSDVTDIRCFFCLIEIYLKPTSRASHTPLLHHHNTCLLLSRQWKRPIHGMVKSKRRGPMLPLSNFNVWNEIYGIWNGATRLSLNLLTCVRDASQ